MDSTMTQDVMTVTVVVAGLFFSFAFALLVEELIFGALFRVFFPKRTTAAAEAVTAGRAANATSHTTELAANPRELTAKS